MVAPQACVAVQIPGAPAADERAALERRCSDILGARRCRIDPFVTLARTITYYRADMEATLLHGVNNVESLNTQDPVDPSARIRLPLTTGADRSLRAHSWRSLPTPARTQTPMTEPTDMPEDS